MLEVERVAIQQDAYALTAQITQQELEVRAPNQAPACSMQHPPLSGDYYQNVRLHGVVCAFASIEPEPDTAPLMAFQVPSTTISCCMQNRVFAVVFGEITESTKHLPPSPAQKPRGEPKMDRWHLCCVLLFLPAAHQLRYYSNVIVT